MVTRTVEPDDWMMIVGTPDELALDAWFKATAGFDSTDRLIRDATFDDDTNVLTVAVLLDPPQTEGDEFVTETLTFTAETPPPCWPQRP